MGPFASTLSIYAASSMFDNRPLLVNDITMLSIKPIEGRSVHQLQSGQVISDGLTSAVKELVENSLDARATAIEVRFKNYGLDLIEVSDNGDGICTENFDSVGLKHCTSKLRTYDDLDRVKTYGFRGEALSSLCALSILSVTTATQDVAPKGSKLEFEVSGKLRSVAVAAASVGTTVTIEDLFRTLPVRRRELERNIKREYTKVVGFLQAYAVVCTGVKFMVTNTVNGKKSISFSTRANKTTRENISNVFGAKTLTALMPLDLDFEMETAPSVLRPVDEENRKVRMKGHISRPIFGRSNHNTPSKYELRMIKEVSRAINEIYKAYNVSQSPFVFADMLIDTNSYDVNVSPDKRTILLHDQANLVEALKVALDELFQKQDQTVPLAVQNRLGSFKQLSLSRENSRSSLLDVTSRKNSIDNGSPDDASKGIFANLQMRTSDAESQSKTMDTRQSAIRTFEKGKENDKRGGLTFEQKSKISNAFAKRRKLSNDHESISQEVDSDNSEGEEIEEARKTPRKSRATSASLFSPNDRRRLSPLAKGIMSPTVITIGEKTLVSLPSRLPSNKFPNRSFEVTQGGVGISASRGTDEDKKLRSTSLLNKLRQFSASGIGDQDSDPYEDEDNFVKEDTEPAEAQQGDDVTDRESLVEVNIPESGVLETMQVHMEGSDFMDDDQDQVNLGAEQEEDYVDPNEQRERERRTVERLIQAGEDEEQARSTEQSMKRITSAFRSDRKDSTRHLTYSSSVSIDHIRKLHKAGVHLDEAPDISVSQSVSQATLTRNDSIEENTKVAEERLSLTIFKSDFAKLKIVGQFNLGFILAIKITKDSKDLFIIDQHASDEKYNFERLQAETIVQNQPLVRARTLELTAMDELVVMENLNTFKRNGFVIEVNDEEQTGQRCKLVSLPMSKSVVFDVKDLEELIHLVHQNPNNLSVRPAKVRAMFAMRACRSSIMIGKTLSFKNMRQVLDHMGELDKPWNCPHGRPTMRHVKDLTKLTTWTGDQDPIEWENDWLNGDDEENEEQGGDDLVDDDVEHALETGNVVLDESIDIEDSVDLDN